MQGCFLSFFIVFLAMLALCKAYNAKKALILFIKATNRVDRFHLDYNPDDSEYPYSAIQPRDPSVSGCGTYSSPIYPV